MIVTKSRQVFQGPGAKISNIWRVEEDGRLAWGEDNHVVNYWLFEIDRVTPCISYPWKNLTITLYWPSSEGSILSLWCVCLNWDINIYTIWCYKSIYAASGTRRAFLISLWAILLPLSWINLTSLTMKVQPKMSYLHQYFFPEDVSAKKTWWLNHKQRQLTPLHAHVALPPWGLSTAVVSVFKGIPGTISRSSW